MELDILRDKINQATEDNHREFTSGNIAQNTHRSTQNESRNPQVIYAWTAPLRAYKKKSAGVLRFYLALALVLSLVAFFFKEFMLLLPIWGTMFLVYVLTITPPPLIQNKITIFGIESAGHTYRWGELSHFYFTRKFDYTQIVIVGNPPYNKHIYLVISNENSKEKILKSLSDHIMYQEDPNLSFTDRLTHILSDLMPQEDDHSEKQAEESRNEASEQASREPQGHRVVS